MNDQKQYCEGMEFETAVQRDGRRLHRCTKCGRVARTQRQHQVPGRTTASHDSTMAILWDAARVVGDELHKILCGVNDPGVNGSVQIDASCGHRVWIAPSGMSMLLDKTIQTETICLTCGLQDPEMREAIKSQGLFEIPGQREELRTALGQQQADDILARVRVKPWERG